MGAATAISPIASHLALQYISYPIQVVGKSAKTMSVFLFTSFIIKSKRGYNLKQKIFAFLIAAGAILYSINKVILFYSISFNYTYLYVVIFIVVNIIFRNYSFQAIISLVYF